MTPINYQRGGTLRQGGLCLLFPVQSLTVMGCPCSAFGIEQQHCFDYNNPTEHVRHVIPLKILFLSCELHRLVFLSTESSAGCSGCTAGGVMVEL